MSKNISQKMCLSNNRTLFVVSKHTWSAPLNKLYGYRQWRLEENRENPRKKPPKQIFEKFPNARAPVVTLALVCPLIVRGIVLRWKYHHKFIKKHIFIWFFICIQTLLRLLPCTKNAKNNTVHIYYVIKQVININIISYVVHY